MQIERISLNAVQLAISTDLGLSLIEITLSSCLAIELLNVVRTRIKQVAAVRLLITRRESTEYQNVLVRDLVETTTF